MTYQSFSNCNPLNINDVGCTRDFRITISKDMYITQDDIYFNIHYGNINIDKINKLYNALHDNCISIIEGNNCTWKNTDGMKIAKNKINEIFETTIEKMNNEYSFALNRQTPLFIFQNIELYEDGKMIACRRISGLDELIVNDKLSLNQIFPGIKFKYFNRQLMIRFQRSPMKNECWKFECHYDLHPFNEGEEKKEIKGGYKEYIIPGGFYTGDIQIEPDVKSFKMVPCVNFMFYKKFGKTEDYIVQTENLIKEYYNKMELKYFKDGLEIKETEFGNSPGLYHIELLNKDDFKNKPDFYRIDYKIICLC